MLNAISGDESLPTIGQTTTVHPSITSTRYASKLSCGFRVSEEFFKVGLVS